MIRSRLLLVLLCLAACCRTVQAADGFMVRVTAAKGEIKLGDKVLATVPRGTRLWAFEVKDREWAKVKVPGGEEKGWLYY